MSFLSKVLIYSYNDSVLNLLKTHFSYRASSHIDFLTNSIFNYSLKFIHPVLLNNLLLLVGLFMSLYLSYKVFRYINLSKLVAVVLSVIYSTSSYYIYRVISGTIALYFIFVFLLIIYFLLKKAPPLILSLLVVVALLISNYYGFFCSIVVVLWYLSDIFLYKKISWELLKRRFLDIIIFLLTVILFISILFLPLLQSNLPFLGKYQKSTVNTISTSIYRPLEDWYSLSFRPWYFFIPPQTSLFFGSLSKDIYKRLESTNYYLADDYMEEEMAGSYMGWNFLLGMGAVATLLLLKKYKKKEFPVFKTVYENKEMITRSFFIIFCILLISGPPSLTIRGITFYTPSYLLYYIIPVFRTLVRWAVVIYLLVLIINSYLIQDLYNLMKKTWQKVLFIVIFLTLNFVIFAIKIPVININKPPMEIAYLKKEFPGSVSYAVYPKGDYYSIFWIISHEDLLINPVSFIDYKTGFESSKFSTNLITKEGIKEFLTHKPSYLIYYEGEISDDDIEKITKVNPELTSREDIAGFFEVELGNGVTVGDSIIYSLDIPEIN